MSVVSCTDSCGYTSFYKFTSYDREKCDMDNVKAKVIGGTEINLCLEGVFDKDVFFIKSRWFIELVNTSFDDNTSFDNVFSALHCAIGLKNTHWTVDKSLTINDLHPEITFIFSPDIQEKINTLTYLQIHDLYKEKQNG